MERPLDTIRSFNAAAEGTANRRSSSYGGRPGELPVFADKAYILTVPASQYGSSEAGQSRPGSYYGCKSASRIPSTSLGPNQALAPGYGPRSYNRQNSGGYYRNNSYGFSGYQGGNFDENAEYAYQDHYRPQPPRAGPGMRNMNGQNPYYGNGHHTDSPTSAHSHQQSYETMTSGSDENGKSTNPSSLNSSYDQLHMQHANARKQDNYSQQYQNQYENEMNFAPVSPVSPQLPANNSYANNANGGGHPAYYGNGFQNGGGYHQQQGHPPQPMPPPKDYQMAGARKPIRLDGPPAAPSSGANGSTLKKGDSTKRQSWLSRKFSRREK